MTLSCPRLTWPAWDARHAGPQWRKMSATSTAGGDNGRASAGHLPQEVERAGHLADRADGDAGVERRRVELLVSEQNPGLRRGRLWMTRISVFCSKRWGAKLCRSFRARNKRHNSERRIIPSGHREAAGFVGFQVGCST